MSEGSIVKGVGIKIPRGDNGKKTKKIAKKGRATGKKTEK